MNEMKTNKIESECRKCGIRILVPPDEPDLCEGCLTYKTNARRWKREVLKLIR